MGKADHYAPGEWNRLCDRTGFKVKSGDTQREWNNWIVRERSWEQRQPQDMIRSLPDRQHIPDPRTEGTDNFLGANEASNALLDPDAGTLTATPTPDGGNTGDGSINNITADLTADSSYTLTVTEVTRAAVDDLDPGDTGEFRLTDSGGFTVSFGEIGIVYTGGGLCFTLEEDGSTAFVVGDKFTIAVTIS